MWVNTASEIKTNGDEVNAWYPESASRVGGSWRSALGGKMTRASGAAASVAGIAPCGGSGHE
jgi:hypothetical protein